MARPLKEIEQELLLLPQNERAQLAHARSSRSKEAGCRDRARLGAGCQHRKPATG